MEVTNISGSPTQPLNPAFLAGLNAPTAPLKQPPVPKTVTVAGKKGAKSITVADESMGMYTSLADMFGEFEGVNADGQPIDPATGLLIDPATGLPIDPTTGLPMGPAIGVPMGRPSGATGLWAPPGSGLPGDPLLPGLTRPGSGLPGDPLRAGMLRPGSGLPGDPLHGQPGQPGAVRRAKSPMQQGKMSPAMRKITIMSLKRKVMSLTSRMARLGNLKMTQFKQRNALENGLRGARLALHKAIFDHAPPNVIRNLQARLASLELSLHKLEDEMRATNAEYTTLTIQLRDTNAEISILMSYE